MKDLNIKLEGAKDTLTILTGDALSPKHPVSICFIGDIKAVNTFLSVRLTEGEGTQKINKGRAIVLVNKKDLTITLHLDPENVHSASITGKLEQTPELLQFGINANKLFSKKELVQLIKFNRLYFESAEKHIEMLTAFQKVSSEVNIKANTSSDERGNQENTFIKQVISNAPTEFMLNIPVFKGYPAYKFRVEVCLDVNEGSARFWFESVELHNLKTELVDAIFEEQLKNAEGLVIINQ